MISFIHSIYFPVNIKESKQNMTALHIASEKGQSECVKILIEAGADVNAKNKKEDTREYY